MGNQDPTVSYIQQENILDSETLESVLEQQRTSGRSLIDIIEEQKLVNEQQLTRIIAAGGGFEFVNLSPDIVDPMAAHIVSHEIASQNTIIPVRKEGNELFVAMSRPLNLVVRDQIELRTGCKVIPLAATPSAINQSIKYHFNVRNQARQTIASMRLKADLSKNISGVNKSLRPSDDPVTKLVYSILTGAFDTGASDIHIEPQKQDVRIRYRVDGLLHNAIEIPSSVQQEVISHIKILSDMDISERRVSQDGHMSMEYNDCEYDLRVSSLPAVNGEKIVIRILDKRANQWELDKIATSDQDNERFRSLVNNPYGMLLLTGPTGCGKTTTLYALLGILNEQHRNIVTVEDPVEYCLEGITQVQVNQAAGRTFASSLRSILRQDPDVVLIGEIRDAETAEIAVSAALTGHFVLSTLHTNDATGAISRLINLGVPEFLVASVLLGVVAQRLVRTTCLHCRQPYDPSAAEIDLLVGPDDEKKSVTLYRGAGCDACYERGYRGRKATYEILNVSPEIRRMIINRQSDDAIKQQAIEEGMKTLRRSGVEEVLGGTTTLEELLRTIDMRVQ